MKNEELNCKILIEASSIMFFLMYMSSWSDREQILAATLVAVVIIVAAIALSFAYRIGSTGTVKAIGIGIYWDKAGTQNVTSFNWGMVNPGNTYGITVFIKNIKNTNMTMSMFTNNFVPTAASKYLTTTWNYTNQVIKPGQVFPYQFKLAVAANITGIDTFNYDITVTAIEWNPA